MAEQSLKDKTVKGTAWTALESVLRYGVSFVVGIILARLLSPDDYGLIGILTIFIAIFEVVINGGFIYAIIRKNDAEEIDYCTVFFTNLVLSIIMAGLLFAGSGLIAKFFKREELLLLMQVMSSILIIDALALVQKARLTKALDFKTQTKVSVTAAILSGIIGVIMAYTSFGVWALVAQQLSNACLATLMYWIVNRWIPKLQFSVQSFREMWKFGWKLMLSGIFNNLSMQLHHVVIGKVFSPASLGQYTRAYQFGQIFSGNLTSVVQRVAFPVMSKIQDNPIRLKDAYRRLIKTTVFPTFILMLSLAAVARPLLVVLIGEKWIPAAYMLQILCISMMIYPLQALNLNAIQVMGRSDLTLRINIIKNLLIAIPVTVGLLTNIYWMLVADVVRSYMCYYLNAYYSKPLLNYSIVDQIRDILPSLYIALGVAIPVYALSFMGWNNYITLAVQIVVGVVLFFGICKTVKPYEYTELKGITVGLVKKNK